MSSVSSSPGTTAARYGMDQLRLQQTRMAAQRAEQTAQSLQSEAANARQDADQARERARSLEVESSQAQSEAVRMRRGLTMHQSEGSLQVQQARVADNAQVTRPAVVQQASPQTSTAASTSKAPVVNTQGQVTGRVINTTA
jgi:hypothetical protein